MVAMLSEEGKEEKKKSSIFDDEDEDEDVGGSDKGTDLTSKTSLRVNGGKKIKEEEEEEEGEGRGEVKFKVNEAYARRFEHNKQREDLHRLQELKKAGKLYGQDEDDDTDDEEEEDEDGLLLPADVEKKFLDTLAKIKTKDPKIYDSEKYFFAEEEGGGGEGKGEKGEGETEKKKKKLYLKDVVALSALEGEEEEEDMREGEEEMKGKRGKTYVEEQKELKKAFLDAVGSGDEQEEESGLLEVRRKSNIGKGNEEEEEEGGNEDDEADEIKTRLEDYFGKDEELDENERFLKDYLSKQGWIDKDRDRIPTYGEVVGEVEEDEEEMEKQDRFEAEFNFRYEEEKGDQVAGHSRVVEGSVRKKPEARKQQRKSKIERRETEDFGRKEDIKRLKNLKRKEILERLKKIKEVAGIGEEGEDRDVLGEVDLEEDFDPDDYDKKMKFAFGEEYYGAEDEGFEVDEEKPDFGAEDELLGLPEGWLEGGKKGFQSVREKVKQGLKGKNKTRGEEEEGDEDDDEDKEEGEEEEEEEAEEDGDKKGQDDGEEKEDADGDEDEEMANGEEEERRVKKKRRRRMSLKEKMAIDKHLDEYYKLDYEDMIGDLPTRFKYRAVKPNMFGLKTEQILTMDDKDLNQVVSVKKLAPFRSEEWEVRGAQQQLLEKENGFEDRRTRQKERSYNDRGEKGGGKERWGETFDDGGEAGEVEETVDKKGKRKREESGREGAEDRGERGEGKFTQKQKKLEGKSRNDKKMVWNVNMDGLTKAAKKNLKKKLKRKEARGETVDAISIQRLQSYGDEALPQSERTPKKKKVRQKKDVVD